MSGIEPGSAVGKARAVATVWFLWPLRCFEVGPGPAESLGQCGVWGPGIFCVASRQAVGWALPWALRVSVTVLGLRCHRPGLNAPFRFLQALRSMCRVTL